MPALPGSPPTSFYAMAIIPSLKHMVMPPFSSQIPALILWLCWLASVFVVLIFFFLSVGFLLLSHSLFTSSHIVMAPLKDISTPSTSLHLSAPFHQGSTLLNGLPASGPVPPTCSPPYPKLRGLFLKYKSASSPLIPWLQDKI